MVNQFNIRPRKFKEAPLNKSKGILDDYAVRKNVASREGTFTDMVIKNILNVASNLFSVNETTGKIGINTNTPSRLFTVEQATEQVAAEFSGDNATATYFDVKNLSANGTADAGFRLTAGGTTWVLGVDNSEADQLSFGTGTVGSSSRMVIQTGGNVGIGTDSPGFLLHVAGTQRFNAEIGAIQNAYTGGSTDALDVTGRRTIAIATTSGNIVIGGLSGGSSGQIITLLKNNAGNTLTIENLEATGTQKIVCPNNSDMVMGVGDYGGVTLVLKGSSWFVVNTAAGV